MKTETPRYKFSRQRESILQLLQSTKSHPTADWVYTQLKPRFPKLSLGTVYRNLNILVKLGKVRELRCGSTFDRFDGNVMPHDHFTCNRCGRIYDLELEMPGDLDQLVRNESGCCVESHNLDFYGLCRECATQSMPVIPQRALAEA